MPLGTLTRRERRSQPVAVQLVVLRAGQALSGHVGAPLLNTRETAALLGGLPKPGRAVEALLII